MSAVDVELDGNSNNEPSPAKTAFPAGESDVPKRMCRLCAADLSYQVKTKKGMKKIVNGVSFDVKSGQVLVIMGPSGAGKTSLLNMLTERSLMGSAGVTGNVTLNGVPLPSLMKTHCSYVEQFSQLWAYLTPREILHNAAQFYYRSADEANKVEKDIMERTGMVDCADVKCGNEFFAGLSGGQRRRLSTAEALVKAPVVVFMDEPLSGLDSAAASNIMDLVYRTAKETNTLFIMTIHMPSTRMFLKFEHVLMLTRGEIAYFGAGKDLSDYCETVLTSPVPLGINPSDHFLHQINPDFVGEERAAECIELWQTYGNRGPTEIPVERLKQRSLTSSFFRAAAAEAAEIPALPKRATLLRRMSLLFRRQCLVILRDPSFYTGRMLFYLLGNTFFALVYISARDRIQSQVNPRLVVMIWFIAVPCNLGIVAVHSQSRELELIFREVRNDMYPVSLYLLVTSLLQAPMIALLVAFAILFPGYALISLEFSNSFLLMTVVFCTFYSFEAAAQLFGILRNPLIGMMIFINWWFVSFLFCGSMVNPDDIIWPLRGLTHIVPFAWGIKGMALVEYRDSEFSGAVLDPVSASGFHCPGIHQMQCYGKEGYQVLSSLHANYRVVEADASFAQCCAMLLVVTATFKASFSFLTWWKCRT